MMFDKLKNKFLYWIYSGLNEKELLISLGDLENEINSTEDWVNDSFTGIRDFENLQYEVEEQGNNINDHEDRIDEINEDLGNIEENQRKYDTIFSKLKTKLLLEELEDEEKENIEE